MALKKAKKLKDVKSDESNEVVQTDGVVKARKARAGGRRSGRTWVIPRKRAETIVQLAGNAGPEKLNALVDAIDHDGLSVNNAANIKYARSQISKKCGAYQHAGTQQFDRLAYAIAHKESALTDEKLQELDLIPENESGELMYELVEAGALTPKTDVEDAVEAKVEETEDVFVDED